MFEKCIYFNSNALARSINRIWDEAFKPTGLSPAHAYLVRMVLSQPGISMKKLADELELAPSTVTRFVDSLIHKDLLRRDADITDKRGSTVWPTSKAEAMRLQLEQTGQQLFQQMNDLLGKKNFTDLVRTMRTIRQQIE
ncbi:MAG: MarR family transcriptional regulator [Gammaproteobacteria bacterium]|nr:MarR family transcriptional regulator [Gammaproteobacteria bacterium]